MKKNLKSTKIISKRYHELSTTDKVIDILVLLGVLSGLIILVIEWFFHPSESTLRIMQRIDLVVLIIFLVDLTRAFFHSKGILDFFKHQWLDLLVITIMIISFSTFAFLGAGRLSRLLREERVVLLVEEEKLLPLLREEKLAVLLREEKVLPWVTRLWKVVFFRRAGRTGLVKKLRKKKL